jgi:hypothetical protein
MNKLQKFITLLDNDNIYNVFIGKLGSIPGEERIKIGLTIKLYQHNIERFFKHYYSYMDLIDDINISNYGGELRLKIRIT